MTILSSTRSGEDTNDVTIIYTLDEEIDEKNDGNRKKKKTNAKDEEEGKSDLQKNDDLPIKTRWRKTSIMIFLHVEEISMYE